MKIDKKNNSSDDIFEKLISISDDLIYVSESESKLQALKFGKAKTNSKEEIGKFIAADNEGKVIELDFDVFFSGLIEIKEWFSSEEISLAKGFKKLRDFLKKELLDVKIYRFGRIKTDITVSGFDSDGNLIGLRMKATDT